jgi:hypothetical protein
VGRGPFSSEFHGRVGGPTGGWEICGQGNDPRQSHCHYSRLFELVYDYLLLIFLFLTLDSVDSQHRSADFTESETESD